MSAFTAAARRALPSVVAIVALLAAWQVATASGYLSSAQFPTMTSTVSALAQELATPDLWGAVGMTLSGWAAGLLIGSVLAIVVGTVLGLNVTAFRAVSPVIEAFKAIPAVAILPLVILILGSTLPMKIFLVSFSVFWPMVVQVVYGVRSIDPVANDTARALGVGGIRKFFVVTIPSASPYIATGLRVGSATALILAVVAELVGGAGGIGRVILLGQNAGSVFYPTMYAYIILSGLLGMVLTGAFILAERRIMHWHESQRGNV